jgi:predicted RNA binding protein YcfA (HicA-like mRNA interferase family)
MKKLPVVSSDDVINALKKGGFEYAPKRGKGSHTALYKSDEKGRKLLVIVPKKRELPKGTLFSILQQANLSNDDLIELLKK